ncbi:V-type proton ATPase subunit e1 [Juglans regia]|uniref:V-type proton ATPase subunit e1 n=2 Tax=Juglandaceae TaxID=16714 RepID=A0A6P9EFL8_JUGRE|nr:V-type proton ATPase subunit e1 [Juglans regia]
MLKVQIINGSPNHSLSLGIGFSLQPRREIDMGFLVTTLIFMVIGIIASLCTRICCNRGPSTNLFHLTLIITATVCCWMMWAIVYLAQMKPLIVPILSEGE